MKLSPKFLLLAALLSACASDPDPTGRDLDYYPLKVGAYWIYDVEEINYSGVGNSDEKQHQLLVQIVDSFTGMTGIPTYVVHRSTRAMPSDPWSFTDTWSLRMTDTEFIESQGNLSIVKLEFPLFENRRWDSNVLNAVDTDEFVIAGKDVTYDLGNGNVFEKSLIINQEDIYTPVLQDIRTEVYARGVGLVYKEHIEIEFDETTLGQYIPAFGIYYVQRMIEYGQGE